jgi:Holliday junction resolvase RusA-like endonuclease
MTIKDVAAPPAPRPTELRPPHETDVLPSAVAWNLEVFVPGDATTKGSIIAIKHRTTGKAIAIPSNSSGQKAWAAHVRAVALEAWGARGPLLGPVVIVCRFVKPRRKGAPKGGTPPHTRQPDGDKLERAVWDALSKLVWGDDSQVVLWGGSKREADIGELPGVYIQVAELEPWL